MDFDENLELKMSPEQKAKALDQEIEIWLEVSESDN